MGGHGGHVVQHDAHVGLALSARDDASRGIVHEHVLGSLRVAAGQRLHLDGRIVLRELAHELDGLGLVALDADHRVRNAEVPACLANAEQHVVGALHHLAVVGGQVRLAFRGVHHVEVDLLEVGRRQLDIGGEAAPPRPTRPLFFIAARNDAWSVTSGGATVSATVWAPSDSMITVVSVLPVE